MLFQSNEWLFVCRTKVENCKYLNLLGPGKFQNEGAGLHLHIATAV